SPPLPAGAPPTTIAESLIDVASQWRSSAGVRREQVPVHLVVVLPHRRRRAPDREALAVDDRESARIAHVDAGPHRDVLPESTHLELRIRMNVARRRHRVAEHLPLGRAFEEFL